jgi:Cu-processing system permease protein
MTPVLYAIARSELRLAVRSRWMQVFVAVFAALALAVAMSGYVLSGGSGMQDFARTSASLLQLVILLVPLTALVFGVIAAAPERGDAELLFSQPVARRTVLAGKVLGVFVALAAAELVGFSVAGLVVFSQAGSDGLPGFVGVAAGALALTAMFLSLAAAVAAGGTSERRAHHLATTLVVWLGTVVLFDIAALGVASLLPTTVASRLLIVSAIVNPVDAVRTGTLLAVEGTTAFGAASLAFLRVTGGAAWAAAWLTLSIAFWIVAPFGLASIKIERADIG